MINDRPVNLNLNPGTSSAGGVASPKVSDPKGKEVVEPKQDSVPTPKDDSLKVKAPEAEKNTVSDAVIAKARNEEVKEKVNQAIPKVRELMNKNQRSLDFRVAEEENRIIVTVIDKETDKVIRQIPPEDLLDLANSIDQGADGIKEGSIINSKA
ncbi:MAG: flagellar protein FlaG [Ketobacter sp.]|nr:flagellar protein FlaG [Ketobacter sp.]